MEVGSPHRSPLPGLHHHDIMTIVENHPIWNAWVEVIVGVAQQVARGNIQPISGAYAALVENSDC